MQTRWIAQEPLSSKPPHCRIPLAREPSAMGPRRLPARQHDRRPGSLKITASCATTGCGVVTRLAVPTLALGRGKPRANLQASFMPAVRAAVLKVSAGKSALEQARWWWLNQQRQLKKYRPENTQHPICVASAAVFHETGNFDSKDSV